VSSAPAAPCEQEGGGKGLILLQEEIRTSLFTRKKKLLQALIILQGDNDFVFRRLKIYCFTRGRGDEDKFFYKVKKLSFLYKSTWRTMRARGRR
jgi:hypothetical protein